MTADRDQRLAQIQTFIHFSPWREYVPDVPASDVCEWGTLAWARYALELLNALDQQTGNSQSPSMPTSNVPPAESNRNAGGNPMPAIHDEQAV